jgi:peroxiredoxin
MSQVITEGSQVEDFSLKDQNDNIVSLSDFAGQKVLLSFHPLAWTSVCANQMSDLEANQEVFSDLNTVPLGVSIDAVPSKEAWAEELAIEDTKLLADFWPHGELAKQLGIFAEDKGFSKRANILLDEEGKVLWTKVYELSELPDIDEVIEVIKQHQ